MHRRKASKNARKAVQSHGDTKNNEKDVNEAKNAQEKKQEQRRMNERRKTDRNAMPSSRITVMT